MTLVFREYDSKHMHSLTESLNNYEDVVKAYISFTPVKLMSHRVKNIDSTAKADHWVQLRAVAVYKELSIDEIDPKLPSMVKDTVIKLHLIQSVVAKRIVWAESLYLHTLAQKVDNYLLKIKLTEYGDWNEDLWGASLIVNTGDISDLDIKWASLLCSADDKEIEQHTKVLVDKLEIAKTTKFRKPFKDAKAHSLRCEKLNIGLYEFEEAYVEQKYKLIWGALDAD